MLFRFFFKKLKYAVQEKEPAAPSFGFFGKLF